MSKAELGRLLTDLLAKVDSKVNFVYWQVTRGVEPRNHVYEEGVPGKLWVSIRPNTLNDPDKPIRLNSEEDTRFYHCNIKTLNLLPSVMTAGTEQHDQHQNHRVGQHAVGRKFTHQFR